MGSYYARHDGETEFVALAIAEHYLPTQSGGALPVSASGQAVAIADKLDTLTGLFGIGQPPSGSKDPFALRRQTLGVIRICIDAGLTLDIKATITEACELHRQDFDALPVYNYLLDRLGSWYLEQGIPADTFNAVRLSSVSITSLKDCDSRVRTIEAFKQQPQAHQLIAANKRIANILKKSENLAVSVDSTISTFATSDLTIDTALFEVKAESELHEALTIAQRNMSSEGQDYEAKCLLLASLQTQVDAYFEDVMVMADDSSVRVNRLATLHQMRVLFLEVADFSVLQ
jgi:glycyl-tRNA synthetase beta chain